MNLSASPRRPAGPSRASGWSSLTTPWGLPCCLRFPCVHAVATTPAQRLGGLRRSFTPAVSAFPERVVGSACASSFSRLARRSLALRPAHSRCHRISWHANQRLQPLRYLHDCSGCFRLERLPGGTCTHWKAPPFHGAHHEPPPLRLDIAPFGDAMCTVVEDAKPEVVSFHFGLPNPALLARVKAAGCRVMSSATTVEEALWLEAGGVDAIIAQGYEAGGHRGMFLAEDVNAAAASQPSTLALVPQIVDAVSVPVIAAGGIADGRGIAAAFALGAAGTHIGTAYLLCPEAATPQLHRDALRRARADATLLTNVFTGRTH